MIIPAQAAKVIKLFAEVSVVSAVTLVIVATVYLNPVSLIGWGCLLLYCIAEVVREESQFRDQEHDSKE
jgi:hypothetical protein